MNHLSFVSFLVVSVYVGSVVVTPVSQAPPNFSGTFREKDGTIETRYASPLIGV